MALALALSFSAFAWAHPGHDESEPGPVPNGGTGASAENVVHITVEGDFRVIRSNGWPDHTPGAFPRRGNPNTISTQSYTFRVPLKPQPAATPVRLRAWWGVALNGVPFEPGTAETWNNDPRSGWRYEASTGFLDLGLDEHNAHVQPTGAYHYHGLPKGLVERLGGDGKKMLLIGWAADGFPIYTSWAAGDPKDPKSELKKMKASYRVKPGPRPAQAGGPGGNYDGRFTEDFEYVARSGDLDEYNGRTGVTPEFPDGTYFYCVTSEFPFVPRMWRGTPDPSFSKERALGGAGGPGGPPGAGVRGFPDEGSRGGRPPFGPLFGALDTNHDQILDADEIAHATEALRKLDRNGDGKLTPEEMRPDFPPGGPRSQP
jgi:hypothetical protein